MNHSKRTTGLVLAIAALACAGTAAAQSCAERATRLKTEIDALPSASSSRTALSESLGIAMGSDAVRCDEILARVEKELASASEGTAAAENPVPNHPTSPAGPATAPEIDDAAPGAPNEKGRASGAEPIPGQVSGNAPPVTGADGIASTADAIVEQGETAQASGDDPIPTPTNTDDGEAPPED